MAAFERVFMEHQEDLKRIIAGMGLGPSDAEDVLQDVFIEARRRPGTYRGDGQAARWLMRVTVNRCLLEYRRRDRFSRNAAEIIARRGPRDSASIQSGPDDRLARAEALEQIRSGLRELDESLLAPLVLRYYVGLDSGEIGEVLDMSASTVRSRLRAGRLALARKLNRHGVES